MKNINMKKNINIKINTLGVVGVTLFICGVLLELSAVGGIIETLELRKAPVKCVGVISSIEMKTSMSRDEFDDGIDLWMYVKYTVDGKEYETKMADCSEKAKVGDSVVIYYHRYNPYLVKPNLFIVHEYVLAVVFLILALTGLFIFVFVMRRYFIRRRLLRLGNIVQAEFESVECNESVEVNGKNPYKICCRWKNEKDGEPYWFMSDRILYDPTEIIERKGIKTFPVYIDYANPERCYHMVLDELKEPSEPNDPNAA